jgi:[ribosomal protein S5]-alanine N-acetyltransferase
VTLEHGAVLLRALRRSDEPAWEEVRPRNLAWTGPWDSTRPPESQEAARSFHQMVRYLNRQARAGTTLPFAICYRPGPGEEPVFAGQLTIAGITYGSARWASAGYWVDRRWAGRGVAPTALAMAADYALFGLKLHRLEVAIRPENDKSLRVVAKLGLRYEGERPRYLHVDGDWRDHSMFAVHADEVGPGGLVGRLPA